MWCSLHDLGDGVLELVCGCMILAMVFWSRHSLDRRNEWAALGHSWQHLVHAFARCGRQSMG